MYFIGYGLLIKQFAAADFWQMVQLTPEAYSSLGLAGFACNLLAVTLGNIAGGAVLVAGVYWLLYRRPQELTMREPWRTR
jgi:formate transporter